MEKRKILYVGNNLRSKKSNITTIETLSKRLSEMGFLVVTSSSRSNKFLRLLDMVLTVLKHRKRTSFVLIDTYSTLNFYYAVTVANLCRFFHIPYIPILHGGNLPQRLTSSKALSYKLFNGAKTNVAPSLYLMEAFKLEGYQNLTYIPNTIEISSYPFLKRDRLAPKLLWVRSFSEIYNPLLALQTAEALRETYKDVTLCMVGPDKDGSLQKCKAYAQERNLPVQFMGKMSQSAWRELSQSYDFFINTTHFDNTPVSVIEAMALGIPVVSTKVGGMPYLIKDGVEGRLVVPNNAGAMANAIVDLLENPQRATGMAEAARKKVTGFDWEKVKLDWEELLKE